MPFSTATIAVPQPDHYLGLLTARLGAEASVEYAADGRATITTAQGTGVLTPADGLEVIAMAADDAALARLPFAALPWTRDQFLIERFGLCHAPSLGVLRFCRSRNPRRASRPSAPPSSALVAAIAAQDDEDPALFEGDAALLERICQAQSPRTRMVPLVGANPKDGRRPASRRA